MVDTGKSSVACIDSITLTNTEMFGIDIPQQGAEKKKKKKSKKQIRKDKRRLINEAIEDNNRAIKASKKKKRMVEEEQRREKIEEEEKKLQQLQQYGDNILIYGKDCDGTDDNSNNTHGKSYCHVYQQNTTTSKRTQISAAASLHHHNQRSDQAKNYYFRRCYEKNKKIINDLTPIIVQTDRIIPRWDSKSIKKKRIFFDGGDVGNPSIVKPYPDAEVVRIQHCSDSLYIPNQQNDDGKGLYFPGDDPPAILLPRITSLNETKMQDLSMSNALCDAMCAAIDVTRSTNTRGGARETISDNVICNLGAFPNRGSTGLSEHSYQKNLMKPDDYDTIVSHVKRCEEAIKQYLPTKTISHSQQSQHALRYPLMRDYSNNVVTKIFSSINIAINAYLRAHTDHDNTISIVSVHLREYQYLMKDKIIAYFVFPTLRIAIALRPGDILIFNPRVPHCLSSKCRDEDKVFTHSMYLKTALVGLNDNGKELTPFQEQILNDTTL